LRFTPREAMLNEDETISDTDAQDKVWTREGTCLKAIPVSVGVTNGMLTQITSGLKAGTKVLTDVTAQQPEEEEQAQQSNPFMPRPGAKKNNKK
ncbi:MAG: efflux RND transporter periplasmic adaptor subunit, partial [Bacteroidaceae bacterium]|nr:efflux RND transporter periplasmic adaptor subunit [Bacteroidaceae bacterium]